MDKKYQFTVEPFGLKTEVAHGTSAMQAINDLGGGVRGDCGGAGICGKCRINASPETALSDLTEVERNRLPSFQIQQPYRLACQAKVIGDVTVTIPEAYSDVQEVRGKCRIRSQYHAAPMVERIVLDNCTQTNDAFVENMTVETLRQAGSVTGQALRTLRKSGCRVNQARTLVVHEQKGITAVLDGIRSTSLGLGVDIGTTTLAAYLCDLSNGRLLASAACANPQRSYGEDVISRIAAVEKHDDGLKRMNSLIVEAINRLAVRCTDKIGSSSDAIDEVVVVGNTTMQTLFAGISPASLGVSPYLPAVREAQNLRAADLGLKINPHTNVYLYPVIAGFLGGDAVGAAIGEGLHLCKETCLIIDIGTNGELVLGNRHSIIAASCATGPALEGANISCGMRAVSGAIYQVEIDTQTLQPMCKTIGEGDGIRPVGICGSGLIDAIAAMRRAGILLSSGRLKEGMPGVVCDQKGIGQAFILVPKDKCASEKPIAITLKDVRAFQLAKSALAVGIEMLMVHFGADHVDRTVLTGAFGAHFNWMNSVAVGMIPANAAAGEVTSVENLAGVGAMTALLDKTKRMQAETLAAKARFVELATDPEFNARFVAGTIFPPV